MGSTTSDNQTKPTSLYDSSPSQPLLSKLSDPFPIQDDPSHNHSDPHEPDSNQYVQISFNYGPSALSRNLELLGVRPCMTIGLVVYYVSIVVFMVFSKYNGKIVPKKSNGEYTCVWKQDGWVPAYFTLAILTILWSAVAMIEAQVYVISGTIAQWYFSKEGETPRKSIRSSLRNAFGPSSGTVCLSGLLCCIIRMVRAFVDSARQENAPGIMNLVLRCYVNALMSAVDFLNKFTINFAAITGEAYCSFAKMTYELLRRNLLSAIFFFFF